MKPLLSAFGVDYEQWKALTITGLKLDLRARARVGARTKRKTTVKGAIVGQLLFYTLIGSFMAWAVASVSDRFTAALFVNSYVLVMIGTAMLVDHNTTVTSPADYAILGFQPIPSRTYFVAKLTNVLVYTLAMTTVVGLPPTIAFFVKHGIAVGAAAGVALYACAGTVTLTIVVVYASLVRMVGARRLRNLLSYVQLLVGFALYGGYFLVSGIVSKSALASFSVPRTTWLLLYPGAWFASYVELAAGRAGTAEILPVLASVALLAFLAQRLRGRLSLDYAAQLGALASASSVAESRTSALKPGVWFRGGEARAVAILVRSQFRNDLRFRMGVLAIVPMTVLYLFMGLRGGSGAIAASARSSANLAMVTFAVLLFPTMLKTNLARSDAFRASWIFFASPADRTRLIRSSKNVLVAFFLVPYLVFVGATLAFFTDNLMYVAVYLILTGLVSHLALLIATFVDPELPFAKPMEKGRSSGRIFMLMMLIALSGSFLPIVSRLLYNSAIATVTVFAAVIGISIVLSRLTRVRIERQAAHLEFEG